MQLETIILKSGTASFCPTALTGGPLLELAHFFSRKQPPGTEHSYLDQNARKFCQSGKLSIGRCKTDRTRRFYLRSPKRQLRSRDRISKRQRFQRSTEVTKYSLQKISSSCRLWVNTNTRKLKSNKSVVHWNRVWGVKCTLLFQINDIDGYSTLNITRKLIHKTS